MFNILFRFTEFFLYNSQGKIYYFIENGITFISSLTIIAISFERYYAISRPLKVRNDLILFLFFLFESKLNFCI
jgi:hypothetical protein